MAKTVWILGAGFSKPLGGPLLSELFTPESKLYIESTSPDRHGGAFDVLANGLAKNVHGVYQASGPKGNRPKSQNIGHVCWSNAEDFLARLDLAAQEKGQRDEAAREVIRIGLAKGLAKAKDAIDDNLIKEFSLEAKRWFAAECGAFVANAVTATEAWEPYKQWVMSLSNDDTILSYNYDLVLEKLRDWLVDTLRGSGSGLDLLFRRPGFTLPGGGTCVYKVHGSINWNATDLSKVEDDFFAVYCERKQMAICTPGPSKSEAYKEWGDFVKTAYSRLSQATNIFFVGYRAPESDTYSLTNILSAIKENQQNPRIGIVLGIGGDSAVHAERLVQLLRYVNKDAKVKRLHMFAQDFLALYASNPDSLDNVDWLDRS